MRFEILDLKSIDVLRVFHGTCFSSVYFNLNFSLVVHYSRKVERPLFRISFFQQWVETSVSKFDSNRFHIKPLCPSVAKKTSAFRLSAFMIGILDKVFIFFSGSRWMLMMARKPQDCFDCAQQACAFIESAGLCTCFDCAQQACVFIDLVGLCAARQIRTIFI